MSQETEPTKSARSTIGQSLLARPNRSGLGCAIAVFLLTVCATLIASTGPQGLGAGGATIIDGVQNAVMGALMLGTGLSALLWLVRLFQRRLTWGCVVPVAGLLLFALLIAAMVALLSPVVNEVFPQIADELLAPTVYAPTLTTTRPLAAASTPTNTARPLSGTPLPTHTVPVRPRPSLQRTHPPQALQGHHRRLWYTSCSPATPWPPWPSNTLSHLMTLWPSTASLTPTESSLARRSSSPPLRFSGALLRTRRCQPTHLDRGQLRHPSALTPSCWP